MTLRILPLLLALAVAAPAAGQSSLVVTKTASGFQTGPATDARQGDAPAALLTFTAPGAWSMRTLRPGDVPAHLLMRRSMTPSTPRAALTPPARPVEDRLSPVSRPDVIAELVAAPASRRSARYSVRAEVPAADLDGVLVRLAEEPALLGMEATTQGEAGAVEATFGFGSVAEWAAWKATPEGAAVLALLAGGRTTLHAQ